MNQIGKRKLKKNTESNICELHSKYEEILYISEEVEENPKVLFEEIAGNLNKGKFQEVQQRMAKEFLLQAKNFTAEGYFKNPCSGANLANFVELNQEMVKILASSGLEPKDIGLTPAAIRQRLLEGYRQMATAWKAEKDKNSRLNSFPVSVETNPTYELETALKKYGFTFTQLGFTPEEEQILQSDLN